MKCDVRNCLIDCITLEHAVKKCLDFLNEKKLGYVCLTSVHGIHEASRDEIHRDSLNQAFLNLPDGMPLVWIMKLRNYKNVERVSGPDFMLALLSEGRAVQVRHYLFGGNVGVAELLKKKLMEKVPGVEIVGCDTPPFRELTDKEIDSVCENIVQSGAQCIWVGISTPKQEKLMEKLASKLNHGLLFGVGAAFDYHSDLQSDAPIWMKEHGLQWLYRLCQDPQRLWRRYFTIVPFFIPVLIKEIFITSRRKLKMFFR